MHGFHAFEHRYPASFAKSDEISTRLQALSRDTLLSCARGLSANIPSGQRTTAGLTKLIIGDFSQQITEFVKLSTEEIYNFVSPSRRLSKTSATISVSVRPQTVRSHGCTPTATRTNSLGPSRVSGR